MFSLPELTYSYQALEPYIDSQTMHLHHTAHHQAYINKLNDALTQENQVCQKKALVSSNDLFLSLFIINRHPRTF
jgi:superoxide dismutase